MPAFYRATVTEFLSMAPAHIIGVLSSGHYHNELQRRQIKAWEKEISIFKTAFAEILQIESGSSRWSLLLEYPIPRRQKRLDAVILAEDVIFCVEFKTEDKTHSLSAQRQAEEYALDLRDFHAMSRDKILVPVLVIPKVSASPTLTLPISNGVYPVHLANATNLSGVLHSAFKKARCLTNGRIDPKKWDRSAYNPIPTIIEAAEALYAGHNIREITHSHAGATNLTTTSDRLLQIIHAAQRKQEKVVCFVTGVPGAGKTLAGLNIIHNPKLRSESTLGVFLSGNGPLVKIVSGAISRDYKRRSNLEGGERTIATFIQNVHVFVREGLEKPDKAPVEHLVVFDEAQRAWNADQNRKKNGVDASEPEILLSIMDRHRDWAVVVALVGGGQEIHTGEAGLAEWGNTLQKKFPHWKIVVSPKVLNRDVSVSGHSLLGDGDRGQLQIKTEPSLHLEVNLRSCGARTLTEWVDAVLRVEPEKAASLVAKFKDFPIALTRSLSTARSWLRNRIRGRRRGGLVASSGALRLRAEGIELSSGFRQGNRDIFVHWFLAEPPDVRSSNQLEVAASEFECQGLELDWIGLCWGGDLRFDDSKGSWAFKCFSGTRWGDICKPIDQAYLVNTYRVLLTRARRGLIVWVPSGDVTDETRLREYFDSTAKYLERCGLKLI
jgi:hypothetical protein